jgi:hypothetical protein
VSFSRIALGGIASKVQRPIGRGEDAVVEVGKGVAIDTRMDRHGQVCADQGDLSPILSSRQWCELDQPASCDFLQLGPPNDPTLGSRTHWF